MATSSRRRKGRKLPPKITDLREQGRPNAKKPYRAYWWNRFSQPPRKGGHGTFETLPEAEKWIQDCERDNAAFYQRGEGQHPRSRRRSFEQVAELWFSRLRCRYATAGTYRTHVRALTSYFGADTPVSAIGKDDVHGMLHDVLKVRQHGEGTAKGRMNVLNQILDVAMDEGLRADNPCRGIQRPREHGHVPYVFTAAELDKVLEQLPDRYRVPVLLAYHSGLRVGEISVVRRRDLELEKGQVRVMGTRLSNGKDQGHTKTGKVGELSAIPEVLIPELERHMKEYPPSAEGYVFTSGKYGGSVSPVSTSALRKAFKNACCKANLPVDEIRFHDLRHTCATHYAEDGAPAYVIQDQLRHGRMDTAQRYIDSVGDETAREWANRVASRH